MNVNGVAGYVAQQIGTGSTDAAKVQSTASTTETPKVGTSPAPAVEQDTVTLSKEAIKLSTLGGADWPDPPK